MQTITRKVDHLVLAVPELQFGIQYIEELLGVSAQIGGQHRGRGTWNALLALGHDSYLEIIAPDPKQEAPPKGRWMGVDQIQTPTLIHWAAKVHPIQVFVDRAAKHQLPLGELSSGSRTRINGDVLSWVLTEPIQPEQGGIIPFLIDWEDSEHPAISLPQECSLLSLRAQHPNPESQLNQLKILDIDMQIDTAPAAAVIAEIRCPKGVVELR